MSRTNAPGNPSVVEMVGKIVKPWTKEGTDHEGRESKCLDGIFLSRFGADCEFWPLPVPSVSIRANSRLKRDSVSKAGTAFILEIRSGSAFPEETLYPGI